MILRRLHRLALAAPHTTPLFARAAPTTTTTTFNSLFSTAAETGPAIGTECSFKLNAADPTPIIQSWDEYPAWLKSLTDTPETMASLEKSYKAYSAAANVEVEDVEKKITMKYERIVRLIKLTNRKKIKEQNETSNDLN
jgi:hypothetical protein